ncbi:MAG: UDP-N-acetylmuramoyl-tripeptide--D-alanyl-D-alanine ligase, partial [Bacteroidetes bacterium]|nr:UDP-N-acetylmuramoyl-tripeptide--D-alanyl-D-alanine ligase [Bacteroidota bacterium]
MPHFSIKDLMKIGQPIGLQANFKATGVSTDSRTIQSGDLFFALQGPQFDGHAYVDTAISKGASACVVSQTWWQQSGSPETKPFVVVDNTLHALQQLATNHRSTYRGPVVAITGTNGKTSCKEMTAAVMSTTYKTLATTGNLNNEIGVPLTLLRIEDDT